MESYHLFSVHETTLEPYAPTAGAYYLVGDAHGTATGGTSPTGENEYTLLSVPPNFVGTLSGGALYWQAVQPLAWNKTRVVTGTAFDRPPPSESKGLAKLAGKLAGTFGSMLPDFLPEDRAICERGQASASGEFAPGVLVPMEHVISDFHQYLARRIHGTPIPPVRSSPEVGIAPPTVEPAR